jgi:hypothetical protein
MSIQSLEMFIYLETIFFGVVFDEVDGEVVVVKSMSLLEHFNCC